VGFGELNNFKCKTCRERGSKDFDSLYATVVYEGAAEDAVKRLKFHRKKPLAKLMGEEMVEFARNEMELEQYELVQAVPLHPIRKRERGYNQAELLAAQLANHCATLQLANSLQRIRPTRVQSRISDPKLRRTNMAGAFAVNPSINLNDKTVLLIDDVVTTGGTVSECAKALKRAGAAKVDVLTFSVPIPDQDVG
jgi:ComF family protein